MGKMKDYVFYIITKKDERYDKVGYSYGVKRNGMYLRHWSYISDLRDIEPYFFEGISCSQDWSIAAEELAQNGNVLIVNTAIEVERIEDRIYGIYLPSFLSDYQINELIRYMNEFDSLDIDVDVQGEKRDFFISCRIKNDFDAHIFLKSYLEYQEKRNFNLLDNDEKVFQKVMC